MSDVMERRFWGVASWFVSFLSGEGVSFFRDDKDVTFVRFNSRSASLAG